MAGDDDNATKLAAMRKELAGLPARRFDGDWFAVDSAGHVAFFAGEERGPVPIAADRERVTEALEAIARAASVRQATAAAHDAYRGFTDRTLDLIFDPPLSSRGQPLHEKPIEGYPLLMVGSHPAIRIAATDWEARDVGSREGLAVVFPVIGVATYEELHGEELCGGCRVLDNPADLRPRAPEALAAAGLYVYVHVDEDGDEPYRRIVAPSVAADSVDLEALVPLIASRVTLPVLFENEASLKPRELVPCSD